MLSLNKRQLILDILVVGVFLRGQSRVPMNETYFSIVDSMVAIHEFGTFGLNYFYYVHDSFPSYNIILFPPTCKHYLTTTQKLKGKTNELNPPTYTSTCNISLHSHSAHLKIHIIFIYQLKPLHSGIEYQATACSELPATLSRIDS